MGRPALDAKRIADKYIARDGGEPDDGGDITRAFSRDLLNVATFVLYHEPRAIHGGVNPDDAFAALCRLLQLDRRRIQEIVRPNA